MPNEDCHGQATILDGLGMGVHHALDFCIAMDVVHLIPDHALPASALLSFAVVGVIMMLVSILKPSERLHVVLGIRRVDFAAPLLHAAGRTIEVNSKPGKFLAFFSVTAHPGVLTESGRFRLSPRGERSRRGSQRCALTASGHRVQAGDNSGAVRIGP
jgi:hypothetical protein